MKKSIISTMLFFYKKIKDSNFLRILIKKVIGNNKIVVNFNSFKVYAGVKTALETDVIFDNYNEIKVLEIIRKFSINGYDFIDVGANIGLHSLTAAKSNSEIDIYSFEPEPENYDNLIRNISLNKFYNIRPFKIGLGDMNLNKYLNINEDWNKGKHSLKINFEGSKRKIKIPLLKLDTFNENFNNEKLIIKIDVEGYEKEVIEGAKKIIVETTNIVLIIELIEQNNSSLICKEITSFLIKNDFELICKINNNGLIHVSNYEGSADYVFVKGVNALEVLKNGFK